MRTAYFVPVVLHNHSVNSRALKVVEQNFTIFWSKNKFAA